MDIKHIFIIVGDGWTKEMVEDELEAECYEDKFAFNVDNTKRSNTLLVDYCDEVWIFGEVEHLDEYKLALGMGNDIWRMG